MEHKRPGKQTLQCSSKISVAKIHYIFLCDYPSLNMKTGHNGMWSAVWIKAPRQITREALSEFTSGTTERSIQYFKSAPT